MGSQIPDDTSNSLKAANRASKAQGATRNPGVSGKAFRVETGSWGGWLAIPFEFAGLAPLRDSEHAKKERPNGKD